MTLNGYHQNHLLACKGNQCPACPVLTIRCFHIGEVVVVVLGKVMLLGQESRQTDAYLFKGHALVVFDCGLCCTIHCVQANITV